MSTSSASAASTIAVADVVRFEGTTDRNARHGESIPRSRTMSRLGSNYHRAGRTSRRTPVRRSVVPLLGIDLKGSSIFFGESGETVSTRPYSQIAVSLAYSGLPHVTFRKGGKTPAAYDHFEQSGIALALAMIVIVGSFNDMRQWVRGPRVVKKFERWTAPSTTTTSTLHLSPTRVRTSRTNGQARPSVTDDVVNVLQGANVVERRFSACAFASNHSRHSQFDPPPTPHQSRSFGLCV